jgi:hypothetical protein
MSSDNCRRPPRRARFIAIPTKLQCFLLVRLKLRSRRPALLFFFPSDVVPAAAASYLLGPEVGEPTGGGDEGTISMAKRDGAGNSVHPSRIELHQKKNFKSPPSFGFAFSLLWGASALLKAPGVPCSVFSRISSFGGAGGAKKTWTSAVSRFSHPEYRECSVKTIESLTRRNFVVS